LYQSFQYANAENKLSVAISGLLKGIINFIKIAKSFAPSILADSVIALGIPFINDFAIIIFHTENISGNIRAIYEFLKCKYLTHNIYHGTSPPLKSVVKKKKNENLLRHGKSFLDKTYPVIVAKNTARKVPKRVTPIVIPYAVNIETGFLRQSK
jgi:hypothetical protein